MTQEKLDQSPVEFPGPSSDVFNRNGGDRMKIKNLFALLVSILMIRDNVRAIEAHPSDEAAKNQVPSCNNIFKKFSADGFQISSRELPKSILIAHNASIYFENIKSGELKLKATQSFVLPISKIDCASPDHGDSLAVNFTAPVLLDLSDRATVGNSVWQFNLMAKGQKVGIWNQVSQLLSHAFKFEDWLAVQKNEISFYQISHDQYEIVIRSQNKIDRKILVLSFDSVRELPLVARKP